MRRSSLLLLASLTATIENVVVRFGGRSAEVRVGSDLGPVRVVIPDAE